MSIFARYTPQSLVLAGSLSLVNGTGCGPSSGSNPTAMASASASASASAPVSTSESAPVPAPQVDPLNIALEGRAGIATMCIETRSHVDVASGRIITPSIYINEMPKEGINTYYVEGSLNAGKWKAFLNPTDTARKAWLKETDIPAQANAAIDLVKRLDKDKNGIVSAEEFEKGEKGVSKEDQLTDLAFLKSLECDNLFFTNGPTNTVDPETFPVVIQLRNDMATLGDAAKAKIQQTQSERDDYKYKFYGACVLSGLLAAGLIVTKVRNRGKVAAPAGTTGAGNNPLASIAGNAMNAETVLRALRAIDGRLAKHFSDNGKGLNNTADPMTTIGALATRVGKNKKALKKAEAEIQKLGNLADAGNAERAIFELIIASADFKFDTAQAKDDARKEFVAALATTAPAVTPPAPPAPPAGGNAYDDVLGALNPDAPDAAVLAALSDGETPPPPPAGGGTGGTSST